MPHGTPHVRIRSRTPRPATDQVVSIAARERLVNFDFLDFYKCRAKTSPVFMYGVYLGTFRVSKNIFRRVVIVAKKRDKGGCRFGFISFKDVKDKQELEKKLRGFKMGDCKLKVNVARFVVENSGCVDQTEVKSNKLSSAGMGVRSRTFSFRDFRSYSDVLGKEKVLGDIDKEVRGNQAVDKMEFERSIVVPERTMAFREMFAKAVVGRTVDLQTMVEFDRLLRIAGTVYSRIQYLGGLSILISFNDETSAKQFLESREIWGPWFTKFEAWGGQSLPLERVAWLRLHGVPLHLLEPDILLLIGELFGKVLHVPKRLEEDRDLSVNRAGVLAGEAQRIKENVKLKWKNRSYRVWVEEEQDEWIPDCSGFADVATS
ncbi:putative RNA-binding domain superfamily [Helianthus annuus]|nr:putative RNA-binding domain superfamily [Helianthus annuus]KAJ0546302.1 putative RNA-binding domain superfamily [Helianthus annuus]KAJ0553060.1 putative RNA-binding domain superfamily [Helianthus annuus]KAJ0721974.1 putative RNA-binding domain superfamily [Helianthus annuus]KAJ0897304.1 putative RNA-binding domain superfamily [Helianthus annuus]